jgi:aldehyde:ferredoxin oxidoreductase
VEGESEKVEELIWNKNENYPADKPMDGYQDCILHVDLARGRLEKHPYPGEWKREYLGGRGLGVAIVSGMVDPRTDPLGPDNVLVFATGPLTGSGVPLGSRYDVVTVSPLTGTLTSANSGGQFGTKLKRAGYDAVVITGVSSRPVYLQIDNGEAELRDADPYWGLSTRETIAALGEHSGSGAKVACIGPAGERLSRMACIINDRGRAAGRGGVGAVMGRKQLKAISVQGEGEIIPADRGAFDRVREEIGDLLKETKLHTGGLHTHGTASLVNLINEKGLLPTRNHQYGRFSEAEAVSGEEMTRTILKKRYACYACMVACGRITAAGGQEGSGPEFETIWAFGPQCGISDLELITRCNYLCNDLGLDTISTGSTIACAMELAERGYLPELPSLTFGDGEAALRLVHMIGMREGIGDSLAEGSLRFATAHGHPELSMSVKGQELPAYDPRGLVGMGLNYATSVRGGCHVYGNMTYPEVYGIPERLDPCKREGKIEWVKEMQDLAAAIDSSGICIFTERALWAAEYAALVRAVTGIKIDAEGFFRIGERIWNLQRIFNLGAGLSREDDSLPQRLREEPLDAGCGEGRVWEPGTLLSEYYAARGWDEQGVPTPEKRESLGIRSVPVPFLT